MDNLLISPQGSPLHLRPGQVLTLHPAHTALVRLRVESGRLWLTRSGDSCDHFLGAGDELLLPSGGGRVVVECDSTEPVQGWLSEGRAASGAAPDLSRPRRPIGSAAPGGHAPGSAPTACAGAAAGHHRRG